MFDLQTALAAQLGHKDTPSRRASEAMMQRYYQTAKVVTQLNTILLQNLEARLAPRPDTAAARAQRALRGAQRAAAHPRRKTPSRASRPRSSSASC